jgi:NADH dehydrogenase FAD-containing subunit
MSKQLVLLGGGPGHVRLLAHLAKQPPQSAMEGVKITLISRQPHHVDARCIPGFVAGRVRLDACTIDLEPLVQKTKAQWLELQAVQLDANARALLLSDGQEVRYDWLSIDLEPVQNRELGELSLPGAQANGLHVHPTDVFCKLWPRVPELAATKALRVAIVCDNAVGGQELAAIELSLAIQQALPGSAVTLITGGAPLASASTASLRRVLTSTLRVKNVTVLPDAAVAVQPGQVILSSGATLACDVPVIATRAHPPAIAASSGLALDERGFIALDDRLHATSHRNVLVMPEGEDAHSLAQQLAQSVAAAAGLPVVSVSRRAKSLQMISCGDGQAIASWGGYCARGRWVSWLKQWLDHSRLIKA